MPVELAERDHPRQPLIRRQAEGDIERHPVPAQIQTVHEIGVPAIRAKSVRQTQRLITLALEAGYPVRSQLDPAQRGGVVVIDVPNGYEVTKELTRREVLVDFRPQAGIRVAPHFYTTDEEIEHTIREVRSIAK